MKRIQLQTPSVLCGLWLAACLAQTGGANAAEPDRNWPQWRGPKSNGIVPQGNPPVEWSEEKNVKWKVAIPGRGHATPAVWGDKIFVHTAVPVQETVYNIPAGRVPVAGQVQQPPQPPGQGQGPGPGQGQGPGGGRRGGGGRGAANDPVQEYTVICLDRATGKEVWKKVAHKEKPHQGIQPSNTHSSASPLTDGERVYSSFNSQGLYCYDLNGNLLWKKDVGKVNVTFGEASSPALHGDKLILVQDNNGESFLYAFDKKTGNELWKVPRQERSGWSTPYFIERAGKVQVVLPGSNAVRSYDLQTGEQIWQCSGLGSNPVGMIVADDTMVYAMSGHNSPNALAIKLGGTGDLTGTDAVVWTLNRGTPYVPSPLLYDGLLYFCQRTDSLLTCLDAKTGKIHFAQTRIEGLGTMYASPIGVQNRVYLASQNGSTAVIEKSSELKVLAVNKLNDGFDASPVVVGNQLFLRGRQSLYCIAQN